MFSNISFTKFVFDKSADESLKESYKSPPTF